MNDRVPLRAKPQTLHTNRAARGGQVNPEPTRRQAAEITADWQDVRARARPWLPPAGNALAIVPHPDDEALSMGGLIAHIAGRGDRVDILAVTSGEGAYPAEAVSGSVLAEVRRSEQAESLQRLAGDRATLEYLEIPDGKIEAHETVLTGVLQSLILNYSLLVAPWQHDFHADHKACGRAARRAAHAVGVPVVGSLFWTWHYCAVEDLSPCDLVKVELSEIEQAKRLSAVWAHESQLTDTYGEPILTASDLEPLGESAEYFVFGGGVQ